MTFLKNMNNIYPAVQGRNLDAILDFDLSLSSTLKSTIIPYQIYSLKSSGIFLHFLALSTLFKVTIVS